MSTPSRPSSERLPPRPLAQRLGAILWASFLAAGVGTMVLFAYFDPLDLAHLLSARWQPERAAAYALGFFFLWVITASSSALTWLLLRPAARFNRRAPHNGRTDD